MKYDILIVGVGGQGILTLSYIIDNAAASRGFHIKQSEVHGMAQRGGAVYSHLRISDKPVFSDLIPDGSADMILSLEPLEVMRYARFIAAEGVIVSNSVPFKNISYPDEGELFNTLFKFKKIVLVDAQHIAGKAKMSRAENLAMLGAASAFLPFQLEEFSLQVKKMFENRSPEIVQGNTLALQMGYNAGVFYKVLLESGMPSDLSFKLVSKLDPATIDVHAAKKFVDAILSDPTKYEKKLDTLPKDSPSDTRILE